MSIRRAADTLAQTLQKERGDFTGALMSRTKSTASQVSQSLLVVALSFLAASQAPVLVTDWISSSGPETLGSSPETLRGAWQDLSYGSSVSQFGHSGEPARLRNAIPTMLSGHEQLYLGVNLRRTTPHPDMDIIVEPIQRSGVRRFFLSTLTAGDMADE